MLVAIFGESCVGKSTLAERLKIELNAEVYTGKDYLRLAKNQDEAKEKFKKILASSVRGKNTVFVTSEKGHLSLLPEKSVRVLMTADLQVIKERFAERIQGILPPNVEVALEKKHGVFDNEPHDFHIDAEDFDIERVVEGILKKVNRPSIR